ncbi:hypothetical protein R3P38DRAFT_3302575 [Favolaschia claudopus]|uniref:Uncharacterized protein n=1 Tax=Favolaschia claudopus TaxID=2862362 RepID=A0AAW0EAY3_9AGAR
MNVPMDDLCASLSSSHVGQEAIDLAALQVQLAQALFAQSLASSSTPQRTHDYDQPCNTPTGRTPSASFSWSPLAVVDASHHTEPLRRNSESQQVRDEMEEDEKMVEDLLIPSAMSSPVSSKSSPRSPQVASPYPAAPDTSLFTTTDPFYIAQLQAAQNYGASPPSVFSQTAFPSSQSPFFVHSTFQHQNTAQNPLSLDKHALFVAATSSFDR